MSMNSYEEKKQHLIQQLRTQESGPIRLNKATSNLFRDRKTPDHHKLDVSDFKQVLAVDPDGLWLETEGMTTYEDLVNATLPHGVLPTVVPELKSITIGGAVTGVGIESSSFKYGLVHETIMEMEVLLADGTVIACTPDNEHKELFFAFPNSYGTLGYALKLKVRVVPAKRYVQLNHIRHTDARAYFEDLERTCDQEVDFVDGTIFNPDEMYITTGKFVEQVPYTSDYTYENIYYQSIRRREVDYLTTLDYAWRWDTDWFWCSKHFYAQNLLVRAFVGKSYLNSVTYTKIMRWNTKWRLTHRMNRLAGIHRESVIQDVDIPIDKAPAFLDFFRTEIAIAPIWICPLRVHDKSVRFDLYPMNPDTTYVNFGFWDAKRVRRKLPAGYYNRRIEDKVAELGGIKSLYSDSYFSADEFRERYNGPAYERLKAKYDPNARLKHVYDKCVLKQ
ncbi:MAG: FAD-binding oxidoreductase [Acidiferrobacterales bacterium]